MLTLVTARRWDDGWTVLTQDGSRSAQFEQTIVVTDTGKRSSPCRVPATDHRYPTGINLAAQVS